MFVILRQSVLTGTVVCNPPFRIFIFRDHLFASAAVPRYGMTHERIIPAGNPAGDQRIHEGNKPACMTARYRDPGGSFDLPSVVCGKFGKTVCPAGLRPVRRGGVKNFDMIVFDHADRFDRRGIGQAQKHRVRRIDTLFSRRFIFAQIFRKNGQFYVFPLA